MLVYIYIDWYYETVITLVPFSVTYVCVLMFLFLFTDVTFIAILFTCTM
jgi:hypothetical protein